MSRLLIVRCSDRKRGPAEPIPALERYYGPLWQTLLTYLRDHPNWTDDLDIYVLSAAFGLIPALRAVPWYDLKMTPERADELRPPVLATFQELMQQPYAQVCLAMSQRYLQAMQGWEALVPQQTAVTVTDGTDGVKRQQLRAWLAGERWEKRPDQRTRLLAPDNPPGQARLAGQAFRRSREEVLAQARAALGPRPREALHIVDWYVQIDSHRVSPKWLVRLVTGLGVKDFEAKEARRALLAWGFDVERNR
jgi:hypothetical protein